MKKIFTILVALMLSGFIIKAQNGTWTQKNDLTGPARWLLVAFSIGSKAYILTGTGGVDIFYQDLWEWEQSTNTWTKKSDFPGAARQSAVGFSIGSKGYIGTGINGGSNGFTDFWEYDPATDTWTQKADFGGPARHSAVGFSIGSKGYIGTGMGDGYNFLKDFWEYDPVSNTWTRKADFSGEPRYTAVGFSIGNKGYIGTGNVYYNTSKDFWEYDPVSNTWTQKADFGGTSRYEAVGFTIDDKAYLGAGYDGSYKKDFWVWDQSNNTWTQQIDFGGIAGSYKKGLTIGTKGYVGFGTNNGMSIGLKEFWEFNPSYSVFFDSQKVKVGFLVEIPIKTLKLTTNENVISYQFDYSYDKTKLEYQCASIDSTIAKSGSVTVNSIIEGLLNVSYMSSTPLSGAGDILKLKFKVLDAGITKPIISKFLFNTDTVTNITNGTITATTFKYGDVDDNDYVQAYDAALALQYSVGIDALPLVDPLPWEAWRVKAANVDTIGGVTAYDAALILQYSAKIINTFAANSKLESAKANNADIAITQEGDKLVFRSQGDLIGLNVFVKDNISALGQPTVLDKNMIKAININDNNYAIGLATGYVAAEGATIMTIPLKSAAPATLSFNMIINNENKVKSISTVTAINSAEVKGFAIYPNPAHEELKITLPAGYDNASVSIFNLEGKQVYNGLLKSSNSSININTISSGIYTIQISNGSETFSRKFVKK